MLRSIANIMKISGCDIPEWMLQLKKINKNERRHLAKHAIKRDDITTQAKFDRKKKGHKQEWKHCFRDRKRGAKKGPKASVDTPSDISFVCYLILTGIETQPFWGNVPRLLIQNEYTQ